MGWTVDDVMRCELVVCDGRCDLEHAVPRETRAVIANRNDLERLLSYVRDNWGVDDTDDLVATDYRGQLDPNVVDCQDAVGFLARNWDELHWVCGVLVASGMTPETISTALIERELGELASRLRAALDDALYH